VNKIVIAVTKLYACIILEMYGSVNRKINKNVNHDATNIHSL